MYKHSKKCLLFNASISLFFPDTAADPTIQTTTALPIK